jgi:pyruvate/2-oxoglutarate dehydrogenase complex dihydrolipoamide dehydrogenase (E3) component
VIRASGILVAVGRKPNVEGLSLENAGVKTDKQGVIVDNYLRTTSPNIYACGDVVGPYQFSHVAGYQGVTDAFNACLPIGRKADYGGVLWTTFTDPELARFGYTETEARDKYGDKIRVYRVPYSALDRAKTDSTESCIAKYVLDKKGKLIGVHILGMIAGEVIHEAQILRSFGLPLSRCQEIMHSYPSYSDITRLAANKARLDEIMNNPFIKIGLKLFSGKKENQS